MFSISLERGRFYFYLKDTFFFKKKREIYSQAFKGRKLVTNTYILKSNFFPPIRRGLSIYFETTKFSFKERTCEGFPIFGVIFFSWLILLNKNIPFPWDLDAGLTIQDVEGFLWNSSTKREYSPGNVNVVGTKSI